MKAWPIYWILGASLAACSTTPLELPTCEVPAPMAEVGQPVSVPEMPVAIDSTEDWATFDRAGVVALTKVWVAAGTNETVASENALAIESRNEEVNQLIECARYSKIWMEVREDMLEQERKDHQFDNYWHRGVILALALGLAL